MLPVQPLGAWSAFSSKVDTKSAWPAMQHHVLFAGFNCRVTALLVAAPHVSFAACASSTHRYSIYGAMQ